MDSLVDKSSSTSTRTLLSDVEKKRWTLINELIQHCRTIGINNGRGANDDVIAVSDAEIKSLVSRSFDFVISKIYQRRYIIPSLLKNESKCMQSKEVAKKSENFLIQTLGGRSGYESLLGKMFKNYLPWLLVNSFVGDADLEIFSDVTNNDKTGAEVVNMLSKKCKIFSIRILINP